MLIPPSPLYCLYSSAPKDPNDYKNLYIYVSNKPVYTVKILIMFLCSKDLNAGRRGAKRRNKQQEQTRTQSGDSAGGAGAPGLHHSRRSSAGSKGLSSTARAAKAAGINDDLR